MATLPTIHLNGTSREELLRQICDAGNAVRAALEALADAQPNGRDYYTQGPDAFKVALLEHTSRLDRLQSVLAELQQIAEGIA